MAVIGIATLISLVGLSMETPLYMFTYAPTVSSTTNPDWFLANSPAYAAAKNPSLIVPALYLTNGVYNNNFRTLVHGFMSNADSGAGVAKLKVWNTDVPLLLAEYTSTVDLGAGNYRETIGIADANRLSIYWGCASARLEKLRLSALSQVYSLSATSSETITGASRSSLTITQGSYLYMLPTQATSYTPSNVIKYDTSSDTYTLYPVDLSTTLYQAYWINPGYIMTNNYDKIVFFQATDMSFVKNMTVSYNVLVKGLAYNNHLNTIHVSLDNGFYMIITADDLSRTEAIKRYSSNPGPYDMLIYVSNINLNLVIAFRKSSNTIEVFLATDTTMVVSYTPTTTYVKLNIATGIKSDFVSNEEASILTTGINTTTGSVGGVVHILRYYKCDAFHANGSCIQCGTSTNFGYITLDPSNYDNTACVPIQNIGPGYGYKDYITRPQPCAVANCNKCSSNYLSCWGCATGYYLTDTGTCQDGLIPTTNYGINGAYMSRCNQPKCTSCSTNYLTCNACASGFFIFNGVCVQTETQQGYGLNTTSNIYVPCFGARCIACSANYLICTQCDNSGFPPYYWNSTAGMCQVYYDYIGTGQGLNVGTVPMTLSSCSVANCGNCTDDKTKCLYCDQSGATKYYLSTGFCVRDYDLPSGYGVNLTQTKPQLIMTKCIDSNCTNCTANIAICVQCATLCVLRSGACYPYEVLPTGIGLNTATGLETACTDANCDDCKALYSFCVACKAGLSPQLYAYAGTCLLPSLLPSSANLGANPTNYTTHYCLDIYCYGCRADYTLCEVCSATYSRYLYNNRCLTTAEIPEGYGVNPSLVRSTSPCIDTNCLKCSSNYGSCTMCKSGTPQYYLYSTACYLPSSLPTGYGPDPDSLRAKSCQLNCKKCVADYRYCDECLQPGAPPYQHLYDRQCYTAASLPKTWGASPTYVAVKCQDANCEKCQADYTLCTQCMAFRSPMVYLHTLNSKCLYVSQIPDGYGAVTTTAGYGTTQTCSGANCTKCRDSYLICTRCLVQTPPSYLYIDSCVYYENLPQGIGGNITTYNAEACTSDRCNYCRLDKSKCTSCKSTIPRLFLHQSTAECLYVNEIPVFEGADLINGNTTLCSNAACQLCKDNYLICSGCSAINGTYMYLFNGKCVPMGVIPEFYGVENITFRAQRCIDARCKYCKEDYLTCTLCTPQTPELFLHKNGSSITCLMIAEFPSGYGADLTSLQARVCNVNGCSSCSNDFLKCKACNTTIVPAIYFYEGLCYQAQDIPNPYGADPLTSTALPCTDVNCISCRQNHGFCVDCRRVKPETFLFEQYGTCLEKAKIPEGWGPDYLNYTLRQCLDLNCKDCKSNYKKCSLCKATPVQYYVYNSECIMPKNFLETYGADNSTWSAQPCSIGCIDCRYDYLKCLKCVPPPDIPTATNPKYYLFEQRCETCLNRPLKIVDYQCKKFCDNPGCYLKLLGFKFVKSKAIIQAQFTESIKQNNTAEIYLTFEFNSGTKRNLSNTEYEISIINDVMLIKLNIAESKASGSIVLSRLSIEEIPIRGTLSNLPFFDFPIRWDNIYLERSGTTGALDSATSTTSTSTASAKMIAQLVVITQNSNIAKIPDQMVANMIYLKLMNGETYLYPSKVFDFFGNSNIPFVEVDNPFEKTYTNPNCLLAPKFYQSGLDCSIMVNYGIDIILIYGTLAINIVLSLIYYLIYGVRINIHKKHNEFEKVDEIQKSRGFKIVSFLKDNYGVKMFFVKLDGTMVEVIFYSFLTLSSQPIVDTHYFYSYIVSISFVCYYVWNGSKYIRLLVHLKPRLDNIRNHEEQLRAQSDRPAKYRAKPLSHYIDFPRVTHGEVGYQMEDFRADADYLYLFAPLVWLLRCVGVNVFLLGGTNMKSGQFYVYIAIQAAYLYYLVKSQVKASRFENWLSYFNEGIQILYISVHAVAYYLTNADFKQTYMGLTQAGLIAFLMLVNVGYVFTVLIWDVMLKPLIRLCQKKSAYEPTEKKGDDAREIRLGTVVKDKNRRRLVVSRAELREFMEKKNKTIPADIPEELNQLNADPDVNKDPSKNAS